MFNIHRHTRLTAAIAAFLLAISSSGFTAVLHSCLMAERSCCGQPVSTMMHLPADDSAAAGQPEVKNTMSCCAVTVAGGLNTSPIVAGNQQPAPQHLDLLALLPPVAYANAQQVLTHPILFSSSVAVSPPSVEKYVLNASFLI